MPEFWVDEKLVVPLYLYGDGSSMFNVVGWKGDVWKEFGVRLQ